MARYTGVVVTGGLQRPGKRVRLIEDIFNNLPPAYRSLEVLQALAEIAGLSTDQVRRRFGVVLGYLEATPPTCGRRDCNPKGGRRGR